MANLINTFQALADIDEIYPNENEVLDYVVERLKGADVAYHRDAVGNIIAKIPGLSDEVLALCAHVDMAAPLNGRQIVIDGDMIATDGLGILGGDDKTAVAAMIELAEEIKREQLRPRKTLELVFTVGEENDLTGSRAILPGTLAAKDMLVFDWLGAVNNVVSRSPGRYTIDVTFKGKAAHPGQWKLGRNAGEALMKAAAALKQGEFAPGVVFTIGIVEIGDARNKVPGTGSFKAEMRSFEADALEEAANGMEATLQKVAKDCGVDVEISISKDPNTLYLNEKSQLFKDVSSTLDTMGLKPNIEETYGRFDGNTFQAQGINIVVLGCACHSPHTPEETVSIHEFSEMYEFIRRICI